MDIDSTVQQANIAYPSDASLMKKLAEKVHRVIEYIKSKKDVWIATAGEVADYWRATYPPASVNPPR
jgi:hypothetical protein